MEFLNVLAAAIGAFAFGAVWYTTLSKPWIAAAGIAVDANGRPQGNGSPMPFVIGIIAMIVVAGMMRHIFQMSHIESLGAAAVSGAGIGAGLYRRGQCDCRLHHHGDHSGAVLMWKREAPHP